MFDITVGLMKYVSREKYQSGKYAINQRFCEPLKHRFKCYDYVETKIFCHTGNWTLSYRFFYTDLLPLPRSLSLSFCPTKPFLISETETESKMHTGHRVPKTGCPSFAMSVWLIILKNVKTENLFFILLQMIRTFFTNHSYNLFMYHVAVKKLGHIQNINPCFINAANVFEI